MVLLGNGIDAPAKTADTWPNPTIDLRDAKDLRYSSRSIVLLLVGHTNKY
jgi:hypothetical protein